MELYVSLPKDIKNIVKSYLQYNTLLDHLMELLDSYLIKQNTKKINSILSKNGIKSYIKNINSEYIWSTSDNVITEKVFTKILKYILESVANKHNQLYIEINDLLIVDRSDLRIVLSAVNSFELATINPHPNISEIPNSRNTKLVMTFFAFLFPHYKITNSEQEDVRKIVKESGIPNIYSLFDLKNYIFDTTEKLPDTAIFGILEILFTDIVVDVVEDGKFNIGSAGSCFLFNTLLESYNSPFRVIIIGNPDEPESIRYKVVVMTRIICKVENLNRNTIAMKILKF